MCLHESQGSVVDWSMNNDEYLVRGWRRTWIWRWNVDGDARLRRWINEERGKLTTRLPMTTVARKKGTQTFEATHLNKLWIFDEISNRAFFCGKVLTPTCNPTSTLSTPHRGRGRRSWSCAWSRWSSILASFSEGTAPHCLKKWNCESESIALKMHQFLGEPLLIVWKSESERIALKWHHFLRE